VGEAGEVEVALGGLVPDPGDVGRDHADAQRPDLAQARGPALARHAEVVHLAGEQEARAAVEVEGPAGGGQARHGGVSVNPRTGPGAPAGGRLGGRRGRTAAAGPAAARRRPNTMRSPITARKTPKSTRSAAAGMDAATSAAANAPPSTTGRWAAPPSARRCRLVVRPGAGGGGGDDEEQRDPLGDVLRHAGEQHQRRHQHDAAAHAEEAAQHAGHAAEGDARRQRRQALVRQQLAGRQLRQEHAHAHGQEQHAEGAAQCGRGRGVRQRAPSGEPTTLPATSGSVARMSTLPVRR